MRILKSHSILKLANSYVIDSAQPSNLSYLWNFGSLLAVCLVIQIITGITLAMHYTATVADAFNSIEHIMRDVNNGWLIRYIHANTASAFFFIVYLHIGRGFYYGSYKAPRTLVWTIGTFIFILMIVTAFLGYVLVYGQMSLWGACVITNLLSAIPWIGQDIVEFVWGGFSVNNATLNRFFALHFTLPFVLAALALMHLIALHDSAGSGNPLGINANLDRLPMSPYFLFKDLITIFLFILILSVFVFFFPNNLGDTENYVVANPMQTPSAIVPEWYLLSFYAILRSIPNKLFGVIAMIAAILMLLTLPFVDLSRTRGLTFRPISKIAFFIFVGNFLLLMQLGSKHVESPYIELGQLSTLLYFGHFLILVPGLSVLENTLVELSAKSTLNIKSLKHSINDNYNSDQKYNKFSYSSISINSLIIIIINSIIYYILSGYNILSCDSPKPWGLYFQDSASPQMEGLIELHDNILFYLVIILFSVGWMMVSLIKTYRINVMPISNKYITHGVLIELIWTTIPALILIAIAFPSFKLLYLMDEVSDPTMAVLAEGHQWYWSYQYADFTNEDNEFIEFDSYLIPESDLQDGQLRLLEVDNRLIIPELTHVRFVITGADTIHAFACPSLGIKCDAYPGRLNQVSVMINRPGTFYGQCSEICGAFHSAMPIVIQSVSIEKFVAWVLAQ